MLFEWDDDKDEINQRKHGISFDTASQVFFDPNIITTADGDSEGEERWQTVGSIGGYAVLLVIHTYRDQKGAEVIRLISARKLSRGEVKNMAIVRKTLEQVRATPINTAELERLANLPDSEIDYSDMPELSEEQIANFRQGKDVFKFMNSEHYRPKKEQVTVRIDSDILAWLKQDGRGYQTRLNDLLRQMMISSHA